MPMYVNTLCAWDRWNYHLSPLSQGHKLYIPHFPFINYSYLYGSFIAWHYECLLTATSEGSIPMGDGEELLIIEHDQGDGWTRVRRQNDTEEGFVPTSYIECTVISNC